jgi:hypothetical protein
LRGRPQNALVDSRKRPAIFLKSFMTHYDIVKKMIGEIKPVGETNIDNDRFENLKIMCALIEDLCNDVDRVAVEFKDRTEFSVKRACDYAENFCNGTE